MKIGKLAGVTAVQAISLLLRALCLVLPCAPAFGQSAGGAGLQSGFDSMSESTQAMQRDDAANPGMLTVNDGARLWARPEGSAQRTCAACHGEASISMKTVAARYPRWDERLNRPVGLSQRIALCRQRYQGLDAGSPDSAAQLALTTFVAHAARGVSLQPDTDPRLVPWRERGRARFNQRMGQLDLSCAACHDERAGLRLGGATIPQGHPNGYPLYRLEWQSVGSLQRRLRNCLTGVRAEVWPSDAIEYIELELHLTRRSAGLLIETPAVRP
jgi:sulfur-oxidizing protein SoxA